MKNMAKLLAAILLFTMTLGLAGASAGGLTYPALPNNTLSITVNTANFGVDQLPTRMQALWQEKMEAYLGCKLDITWNIVPWMDFRNNEAVLLASGDIADVNTYSQSGLVNEYGQDKLVLDINKYAAYMQYYPEFVNGAVGGQAAVNNKDGSSYVFWDGYVNDLNLAGAQSFTSFAYRFDVLQANGLAPATSWQEFKDLCASLQGLIKDGKVDAKYVMSNGANWMAFYRGFVGIFHTWDTTYWNGTQWSFGPVEENFRAMLKELHDLYAAGYIDPEFATDADVTPKTTNGQLLMVPTCWSGSAFAWNSAAADGIKWGLSYLPSHPDYGTAWKWGSKLNGKTLGTNRVMGIIISADTKYPEYVVRMIDYQYSEEMYNLLNWGIEGETFVTKADGTKTYVDAILNAENPGTELANIGIMASSSARTGIPFVPQIFSAPLAYSKTEPWWNPEKGYYDGKYWIESAVNGGPDSVSPYDRAPYVDLTQEEATLRASVTTTCETFARTEALKFITGEHDPYDDAQWAAYVSGVKSQVPDFDGLFALLNEKTDLASLEYYK